MKGCWSVRKDVIVSVISCFVEIVWFRVKFCSIVKFVKVFYGLFLVLSCLRGVV